MGQNELLFYMVAAGCMVCLMIGIIKRPVYLLVLLFRGAFCSAIVYGIYLFCIRKGVISPLNLNIISIGTGALLGLPGIIVLYVAAIFLTH